MMVGGAEMAVASQPWRDLGMPVDCVPDIHVALADLADDPRGWRVVLLEVARAAQALNGRDPRPWLARIAPQIVVVPVTSALGTPG